MKKYLYIIAILSILASAFYVYRAIKNTGKIECEKDNTIETQTKIINNQKEIIYVKSFQDKISSKPSNNSDINFRREWLQKLYAQRTGK